MTHLLTQDYFTACSDVYGDDEGFRALLEALTASEDFHTFQQMMCLVTGAQGGSPSRIDYGIPRPKMHTFQHSKVMLSNHVLCNFVLCSPRFMQMMIQFEYIYIHTILFQTVGEKHTSFCVQVQRGARELATGRESDICSDDSETL